jgi:uncharacterized membrane protein
MKRPCLLAPLALLGLTLFPAVEVSADVVYLRDGTTLEGQVVEERSTILVRQRFGEVRVERTDVLRIEETIDPEDELAGLQRELGHGTADERYQLAVWCRAHGFDLEAQRAFLSVLRVDTDHPGARAALGYVLREGRWLTIEDMHRADGLVEYRGEWMTPEEQAAREAQAREDRAQRRLARQEIEEAEREARREEREARREARRQAREEYYAAVNRQAAVQRALDSYDQQSSPFYTRRVLGDCYYGGGYGRTVVGVGGVGVGGVGGAYYRQQSSTSRGYGAQLSGSYSDDNFRLRWRVGY